MRWLALCDADGPMVAGADAADAGLLHRGSLVLECRASIRPDGVARLLDYASLDGWPRQFGITLSQAGSVTLFHRQADYLASISVTIPLPAEPSILRLTYIWDSPRRMSQITAEIPSLGVTVVARGSNPLPLPLNDVAALSAGAARCDAGLIWFGISAGIERFGIGSGLIGATPVRTAHGFQRLDSLQAGDMVATRSHGLLPIRWIGGAEMPARGSFAPVRLRAPFFGNRTDLVVSAQQRIVLSGTEVEYLFGEDEVAVEAARLVDGMTALTERRRTLVRFHALLLDEHAVLDLDGGGAESLLVLAGRSPNAPEHGWLRERLAPGALPFHRHPALPSLRGFEAATLLAMRRQVRNPAAA